MKQRFYNSFRRLSFICAGLICFQFAFSQYYYNDILQFRNNNDIERYRANKVKGVSVISIESTGERSPGFSCDVTFNADYSVTRMVSRSSNTVASTLTTWYGKNGLIEKSADSSGENITTYSYTYNQDKQLTGISSVAASKDGKSRLEEKHVWFYEGALPVKMQHIRDGRDTLIATFILDEQQRVVEEITKTGTRITDRVYYYYDDQDRLTDIVRYNARLKELLPDFMFEYDGNGRLSQLISVTRGSTDYLTWRYQYESNGLKSEEACFNKQKQLLGMMRYEYRY
ncbi:MAG: hypothetical protein KIT80_17935 [Chitinophagaceae bacterium]|nr:hypothetical protein [Chitinophagaceae bacterium]MCW5928806.1 hypothetical protein [Chitinophagaceae bacterium]